MSFARGFFGISDADIGSIAISALASAIGTDGYGPIKSGTTVVGENHLTQAEVDARVVVVGYGDSDVSDYLLTVLTDGQFLKRSGSALASAAVSGGGATPWDNIRGTLGGFGAAETADGGTTTGFGHAISFTTAKSSISNGTWSVATPTDRPTCARMTITGTGNQYASLGFAKSASRNNIGPTTPFKAIGSHLYSGGSFAWTSKDCSIVACCANTGQEAPLRYIGSTTAYAFACGFFGGLAAILDLTDGTASGVVTNLTADGGGTYAPSEDVVYHAAVDFDGDETVTCHLYADGVHVAAGTATLDTKANMANGIRLSTCVGGATASWTIGDVIDFGDVRYIVEDIASAFGS